MTEDEDDRPEEALWLPPGSGDSLWLPSDDELSLLSDDEIEELHALLEEERAAREGEWRPQPKQELASRVAHQTDELLFGGAAGGGKTEWGIHHIIDEMERHRFNRGAIFRRVFPSLNRTIIPRAKAILRRDGRARWNGQEHTWTFPNGSVLEAAHLQHADTVHDYQGAEFGIVYFEEITEFLESQYAYLLTRLRSPGPGIRPHSICTTNPGGLGHRWVKRRWIKPRAGDWTGEDPSPYRIWQPALVDDEGDPLLDEEGRPMPVTAVPPHERPGTRCFVPSTLDDNPALLARDPKYRMRIRANPNRGMRLALEKGDWDAIDAVEGALWRQSELDQGRVTAAWHGLHVTVLRRVVAVDPSDGDEDADGFGVAVCSRGMDGVGYVERCEEWKGVTVRDMARGAVQIYHATGADALIVERNHGGKWMMEVFRQVDRYANIVEVWASHGKITRAEPVAALFEPDPDAPTFANRFRARLVGRHEDLEEEMTSYTGDPKQASPNRLDAVVWAMSELMLGLRHAGTSQAKDERLRGRR